MRLSTSLRLNAQKGLVTPYDPTLTLSLQFAARQAYVADFGPLPTFTNATTTARTYVGSDGLLKTAATNVPRIEFDPITRQCLGLLIEEQRSNLTSWSEDFTQASWSKTNTTATANQTVAPDGNTTADLISETTANTQHYLSGSGSNSITSGTTYTTSVFLKKGTGSTAPDWIIIAFLASGFGSKGAAFNVSTGAVGTTVGSPTVSVKQYSNGWWRVSLSAAATASVSTTGIYIAFSNNANVFSTPTYVGQTTSNIFIWGAQFEAGSFASSYIPTVGTAPLIRSADVCSITGAAFTGFYNQTEGTIVLKYVRPTTASSTALAIDDNTATERMINVFQSGIERFGTVDGANTANLDRTAGAINTVIGHASRYKNLDFAFSANGSAVVTSITQTVPTPTQMLLGYRQSSNYLNGHIHTIQYFNAIKTNAQLQALSTP